MEKYVDSFEELDPEKWVVLTGRGSRNRFWVDASKFWFETTYGSIIGQGFVALRSSSPFALLNNRYEVEFELEPYSQGFLHLIASPHLAEAGVMPWSLTDMDIICFNMVPPPPAAAGAQVAVRRVRNGGVQFSHITPQDPEKRKGKLSIENRGGVSKFYIDDVAVAEYATEFKVVYIYIVAEPALVSGAGRFISGTLDNFTIEDYELSQVHPDLAAMSPILLSLSQTTFALLFLLAFAGMAKGLVK